MKAKDFALRVVNEIEPGKFEIKEFKPYMSYESFIGCILGEAEILRPTGLKDKNGKKIYEGDILTITYEYDSPFIGQKKIVDKGVVEWEGYSDGEYVDNVECWMAYGEPISDLKKEVLEVIGNVYQNPELLEAKS